jgi:hypothetical protein
MKEGKAMPRIYADLIRKGKKTIDDVPEALRDEVAELLGLKTQEVAGD